jgi:hypothetical protein
VSNKDVKQDALDNLADALTEDILNTPDDELLREVEEDYGDPRALANKFDQILERAEKQVFGTARSAASPQVRSSVLDLPISLADETIRRVKGIFDLGSRLSEFLSSLRPRTLAWSATAAAVVMLVQAAVITAVVVKEQGAPSRGYMPPRASLESEADRPRAAATPSVREADRLQAVPPSERQSVPAATAPGTLPSPFGVPAAAPSVRVGVVLSDEEIAAIIAGGRQLMVAGDIPNARLVLQPLAESNATAALELGATYDPTILQQQKAQVGPTKDSVPAMADMADIRMARLWYEKARDLGSTEAAVRLEKLRSVPSPGR